VLFNAEQGSNWISSIDLIYEISNSKWFTRFGVDGV
jgi:hypothetical protein